MSTVTPVPPGYHSLQAYLVLREPAKAIEFYQTVFGAIEIVRMTMPDGIQIMHAELQIGDSVLMLSGEALEMGVKSPEALGGSAVNVMHYTPEVDAIYAKAIAHGSKSIFPPADMFWGDRFCKFVDPFGHIWGVATHIKDPTPEELEAGRNAAFAGNCGE